MIIGASSSDQTVQDWEAMLAVSLGNMQFLFASCRATVFYPHGCC